MKKISWKHIVKWKKVAQPTLPHALRSCSFQLYIKPKEFAKLFERQTNNASIGWVLSCPLISFF